MATRRNTEGSSHPKRRPATTPEGRERQLIAKAVDLAERQMDDGTASSQVISHYLKLGSSREMLEQERLAMEVDLLATKKEALESAARVEEIMKDALKAFKSYTGQSDSEEDTFDA